MKRSENIKLERLLLVLTILNVSIVIFFGNLSIRYTELRQEQKILVKHLGDISDKQIETLKFLVNKYEKERSPQD